MAVDVTTIEPGDLVRVGVTNQIVRLGDVIAIDLVYERAIAVRLVSTGALRTLPLEAVLEHYPASSSPAEASSSTTSAS